MSYWIRWQLGDIPLGAGTYFVGRSPAAHVVINDPRVSRSHASVSIDERGPILRDLSSQNGVYLNGRRVTEAPLTPGDRILIGGQELEFIHLDRDPERHERVTRREHASTQRVDPSHLPKPPSESPSAEELEEDSGWSTRRADPLELLASVADKTLALGRAADAERMMQSHLKAALQSARQGAEFSAERAERVSTLALRLATALRKPEWVNYVFELYTALKMPFPTTVVESLYSVVRQVSPVSINTVRQYIQVLRARGAEFSPAERFVVQRIEGLERVITA